MDAELAGRLAGATGPAPAAPDMGWIRRRARRLRNRRRAARAALPLAATAVVAAVVLVATGGSAPPTNLRVAGTPRLAGNALAVGFTNGSVEVLSARDGSLLRTLRPPSSAQPVLTIASAPGSAATSVSFGPAESGSCYHQPGAIVLGASAPSPPVASVSGWAMALDEHDRFAQVEEVPALGCHSVDVVVTQGMTSSPNDGQRWRLAEPPNPRGGPTVSALGWSPDGHHLVLSVPGRPDGIEILDTSLPVSGTNPVVVGPGASSSSAAPPLYRDAQYRDDGSLVAVTGCDPARSHCATPGAGQDSVVVVEPGTGRIAERLFSAPDITAIAADPGSSRIAFVSDGHLGIWDGSSGSGPARAEPSHPLASGVSAVAWTSANAATYPPGTSPAGPGPVTMPDVVGQPASQATATLNHLGLDVTETTRSGATTAPGFVVSEEPGPGSHVARGSQVSLGVAGDAVDAGALADGYRFHVTTMTIRPNGTGTASWRSQSGGSQDYRSATFHLTSVNGRSATGVVDSSTEPAAWAPGHRFSLTLGHNDMLVVTPSGPFAPLCGSVAQQQDVPGHAPQGVNCGA